MTEIKKIEELNGKNYSSWSYNAKLLLMERGLWGITNGSETKPVKTEGEANETFDKVLKAWQLRSDKAYSAIALNIEKS
jgi:hypothetical protein